MGNTARRAAVGGLALASAGLVTGLAGTAHASTGGHLGPVFVQTDNPAGNSVVVYDRAADGTLHEAGSYPTGGLGGVLDGSVVDHLASQGALAYDRARGLLYAVNAGSNTVTVFDVSGDRLVRRQVIRSGGTFPVSIAVRGNVVYVLNARDGGSVQGFLRLGDTLVRVPLWHRSLGLDPTLTAEFTSTPGQVAFSPDGTKLIVTTKGNGSEIEVFGVNALGGPSATPVVTADPAAVPFAVAFDPAGHLDVAEAGTNAVARFTIGADRRLTLLDRTPTGQVATCWIVADTARQHHDQRRHRRRGRDPGRPLPVRPDRRRRHRRRVPHRQRRRADPDRLGHRARRRRRRGHRRRLNRSLAHRGPSQWPRCDGPPRGGPSRADTFVDRGASSAADVRSRSGSRF